MSRTLVSGIVGASFVLIVSVVAIVAWLRLDREPDGSTYVAPPASIDSAISEQAEALAKVLATRAMEELQLPADVHHDEKQLQKVAAGALFMFETGSLQSYREFLIVQGFEVGEGVEISEPVIRAQSGMLANEGTSAADVRVVDHGTDFGALSRVRATPEFSVNSVRVGRPRGEQDLADPTQARRLVELQVPTSVRQFDGEVKRGATLSIFFVLLPNDERWVVTKYQLIVPYDVSGVVFPPL